MLRILPISWIMCVESLLKALNSITFDKNSFCSDYVNICKWHI